MTDSLEQLLCILRSKEDLNADFSQYELDHLFSLADEAGEEAFSAIAEETLHLIDLYRATPTQRLGKEILSEYFHALDSSARLLTESGEISPKQKETSRHSSMSTALVLQSTNLYSPLDRCKILNRSQIPQTLTRAADAFRRRLEIVDSVIEIAFQLLQRLSPGKFHAWIHDYLQANSDSQEPEIIRDLLKVLLKCDTITPQLLQWSISWDQDEALLEQWPRIIRLSDKLLCREALIQWSIAFPRRNSLLAHLNLLVTQRHFQARTLLAWLTNALEEFGSGVHRFLSMKLDENTPDSKEWLRITLKTELQRLASLYRPIMIICGETLTLPDGARSMAMAFLGLTGNSLATWEKQSLEFAEQVVLRVFLTDLRENRKPTETIKRLTFGDETAYNLAVSQLDIGTQSFESTGQRRKVIKQLAVYYASYRRSALLGTETAKRYRAIMRILHEDYLQTILSSEDMKELADCGLLHDLSAMATAAKKYLDHRRALQMTVEELVSSEIEFVQETRTRRLHIIRELLASLL